MLAVTFSPPTMKEKPTGWMEIGQGIGSLIRNTNEVSVFTM
jgi:hypothetical protein